MTVATIERKPGDVLDYVPCRRHCREGIAVVLDNGLAVDTFWSADRNVLTPEELATAGLRFRLSDFHSVQSKDAWLKHAPADRQVITAQHGLQPTYYVRNGAEPDLATQIENAREAVAVVESEMRTLDARLTWRREELAELEAVRDAA